MKKIFLFLLAVAMQGAAAHNAWLDPQPVATGKYVIKYGHPGDLSGFMPAKIKSVVALDASGKRLPVELTPGDDSASAFVQGASLLALDFDNGYFTRTPEGTKNTPKNATPGGTSTLHSLKFSKTVLQWDRNVTNKLGHRLEAVAASPAAPKAGAMLPLTILWEGKPLANATVRKLEDQGQKDAAPKYVTDAQGRATVPVIAGWQQVEVEHEVPLKEDARADRLKAAFVLTFEAR